MIKYVIQDISKKNISTERIVERKDNMNDDIFLFS